MVLLAIVCHDAVLGPGVEMLASPPMQALQLRLGFLLCSERLGAEPPSPGGLAESPGAVVVHG